MKKLMITGGLIGFLIGIISGLVQDVAWPAVLWRASITTFAAGMLLRWWGRVWFQSLQASQAQRLAAEAALVAAQSPKP